MTARATASGEMRQRFARATVGLGDRTAESGHAHRSADARHGDVPASSSQANPRVGSRKTDRGASARHGAVPASSSQADPRVGSRQTDAGAGARDGRGLARFPSDALIGAIRLYQVLVSPALPNSCRYEPSCSRYAAEAIRRYGALKGSWFALKRLARCHPFGGHGYDPVP